MAPKSKSALSAALASPQGSAAATPPRLKENDSTSFPCLNPGADGPSLAEESTTDGVERIDVGSLPPNSDLLAGSMPTTILSGSGAPYVSSN